MSKDDREKYMASQLCRRGVLIAKKVDDEIIYKLNKKIMLLNL